MVDTKHTPTVNQEKKDVKDVAVQAVTDLDLIIANADTATTAQLRDAIKKLAQHQKKMNHSFLILSPAQLSIRPHS